MCRKFPKITIFDGCSCHFTQSPLKTAQSGSKSTGCSRKNACKGKANRLTNLSFLDTWQSFTENLLLGIRYMLCFKTFIFRPETQLLQKLKSPKNRHPQQTAHSKNIFPISNCLQPNNNLLFPKSICYASLIFVGSNI